MSTPTPTVSPVDYTPYGPVIAVTRLRLWPVSQGRIGTPAADVGPAVSNSDGSVWTFQVTGLDGLYLPTVDYTDSAGVNRTDAAGGPVQLPQVLASPPGSALAAWFDPEELSPKGTPAQREEAAQAASEVLWLLSGCRYSGPRARTVRPAPLHRACWGRWQGRGWDRGFWSGRWGAWWDGCDHTSRVVNLGDSATRVVQVLVNGQPLDPQAYRLDTGGLLVRTDGQVWPSCQAWWLSPTEPGTFQVTYVTGRDVPASGVRSARALALAYLTDTTAGGCALPSLATQVTGDGITVVVDNLDVYRKGGTGVKVADAWIYAVNPSGQRRRPAVLSPNSVLLRRPL